MKFTALDLINKLAQDEHALSGQTFIAPLTTSSKARIRVRGLVYELQVRHAQAGWWLCRMINAKQAELVDQAEPWHRGEYLALWPTLRLVLLEPLKHKAWLALPYNPSDAAQRFGLAGPVVVQLVEGGQPFERVIGRVEGNVLWYDDLDHRAEMHVAESLRTACAAGTETHGVSGIGAGENAAFVLLSQRRHQRIERTAAARSEQRISNALRVGGARLVGYETTEHGIRVIWERDGHRNITLVDTEMGVVSAGICLSGEDQRFDLTSIVGVVQDAPVYARLSEDEFLP